jgi:hypothetical protein
VKNDVQSENVALFTTRTPAVYWGNSPGTVLGGPMAAESLTRNANDPLDDPFRCRSIPRKKARTTSAGSGQLPTWEEENCKEAAAKDGSD